VAQVVKAGHLRIPLGAKLLVVAPVGLGHRPALQPSVERLQDRSSVTGQRNTPELVAVQLRDVDVDKPDVGILKRRFGGGREIRVPRPDADDHVGARRDPVGRKRARRADAAERTRVIVGQRSFACLGLRHRHPGAPDQIPQGVGRLRVDGPSARDKERAPGGADDARCALECRFVGQRTGKAPGPLLEELGRIVERFRLHVLGQRQRDRAGVDLTGQHSHRRQRRGDQLFRTLDPVEVPRHGYERVVDADVAARGRLQLLQHGVGPAGGKDVTW